ncbi:hypothetical protein JTE90_016025 [Oedothorax gibbosus]|uniref:VWFC domain-containing protein n=1 Tax=Oedothorax gibbosus TaxID=931172 RepID=A0AAV6VTV8_9ARAC|nr:hypothetical protein JTE90_016025 [Oedothorax gibbosus]
MHFFPVLTFSLGINSIMSFSTDLSTHIILIVFIDIAASLDIPPASSFSKLKCSFIDQVYEVNQTWYKYFKNPEADVCVRCICKADTFGSSARCTNTTCNRNLCEESTKHECCSECYESVANIQLPKNDAKFPCLHNGKIYQDGEEFSSNSTSLQAKKPNQCIHCKCKSGLVLCRLKNCDSMHCFSMEPQGCCSSCVDEMLPSEQASQPNPVLVTIMLSSSQSHNGDCIAAGITYSHGSSWHPVIGPFGPMDCVYCKCQNEKIECSRLSCPPLQTLPCSKPIQEPGHCCPVCTEGKLEMDQPSVVIPVEQTKQHQNSMALVECLPPQTNTVVFRSHASSSSSAYYQYAFQPAIGEYSTRLLTWTIKNGRLGDYSEQHLSKEEFRTLMTTFQFKLQGATRTKFMEKFIRKAKRLPDRCGGRCATKIQQLGQVLHLREVVRRQNCLTQEIPFHQ